MHPFLRFAMVAALAAVLPSQTFVVDASNGPGTDYPDLPTAVASVPDGSTLIVRAGAYGSFSVAGKGLTIVGEPGAAISQGNPVVIFSGTNASQRVVVTGVRIAGLATIGSLRFLSCQGGVHVEDCFGFGHLPCWLTVDQCAQVSLVRCAFGSSRLVQSNVVCVDTSFATDALFSFSTPLELTGGQTQLAKCSVSAWPTPPPTPTPGIVMNGGSLRLLGPGVVNGGTGRAIDGTGTVRAVPTVSLSGLPVAPGITLVAIDEASTSSTAAPIGGTVTATLAGSANLFGGLVLGFPQQPSTVPGVAEELWLNPLGFAITGMLAAPLTFWLDVPSEPVLRGLVFGWQGLTFDANAGAVLSNPAWFCVQ